MGIYRNRPYIAQELDPRVAEAMDDLEKAILNIAQQTNANPTGLPPQPTRITDLQVTAANGMFDFAISDPSNVRRGIRYFIEASPSPSFNNPKVFDLGTSRDHSAFLGNGLFYFRAYSQYPTGDPSEPLVLGGPQKPKAVSGGGAISGPVPLPSGGSGTAKPDGSQGGWGYGKTFTREPLPPTEG